MEYKKALMASVMIRKLSQKLKNGTLTAREMNKLASEYGKIAGECIRDQLLEEYPNGNVQEADVRRIISPILKQKHRFISEIAAAYQNDQYRKAGVGLRATSPEYNQYREDELVKDISRRSFADGLEG